MSKEVAVLGITEEQAVVIYTGGGIEDILAKVRTMEKEFKPNMETLKGRDEVRSTAHKVAKLKTRLDAAGKSLNDSRREAIELVNVERRKVVAECDEIRDRIRKPLTDYEEAEKVKEAAEKLAAELIEAEDQAHYAHSMWLREKEIEKKEAEAEAARIESERVEAEKKAKEEAERVEAEREAAEKMRIEEAEKQAAERGKREAEEAAQREKEESERKVREAEEATAKAKLEAENAELEKKLAAERAEKEKEEAEQQAREDEQRKQREKEEAEAAAQAKLEANQKHVSSILKAAKEGLMNTGLPEATAKQIVLAIKNGEIPNVQINY